MPGRHGKQVKKRNRSKRQPVTEMETTLKDSIHGRTRKERAILKDLIPPRVKQVAKKVMITASMPMFQTLPVQAVPSPLPIQETPSTGGSTKVVKASPPAAAQKPQISKADKKAVASIVEVKKAVEAKKTSKKK